MTFAEFASILKDLSVTALVLAALFGGAREMWVYGWVYHALVKRLEWTESQLTIALNGWETEQKANEEHYRVAHPGSVAR